MEIQASNVNNSSNVSSKSASQTNSASDVKFADELKELKQAEKSDTLSKKEEQKDACDTENKEVVNKEKYSAEIRPDVETAIEDLKDVLSALNQSEDNIKDKQNFADNNRIGVDMINNDFSIENKDKLPQMNPNTSFSGDGQPFSSFMNNAENYGTSGDKLSSSAKDLAEEAEVLSTMAENIAMANKAVLSEKTVMSEDGIKKVDTRTNITKEVIVSYNTVIMDKSDVDFFVNLVDGNLNLDNLSNESVHKSLNVSKTLADLLAKSMQDNKPVRIEFDNGISVIIKISRDGKLSADFLPSTQVAEAYLKENLPLLKQRFDEQNIEYGEFNRRERQNRNRDENQKKGRENE